MLGVLGTVIGVAIVAQAVETTGEVHTPLLWGGIRVSLITTLCGLIVFAVSALIWFGLRQWHRRAILREA